MNDNIGGIAACFYTFLKDVKNCAVLNNGILFTFQPKKDWKQFEATPNKTEVQVTSSGDGESAYDVNISISIPRFRLAESEEILIINNQKVLFKYTTQNGDTYIVGDKENFLTAAVNILNPGAASGYSGIEIQLTGTTTHPELPLL